MIKSWWAEKSTSEKQIVAALAVLSLGVFCWLGVIKPIDTYIAEHQLSTPRCLTVICHFHAR